MKKTLLISAALMVANAAFSQGTIQFANNSGTSTTAPPGQVNSRIYDADPSDPTHRISGNTASGVPAGTTSYGSASFIHTNADGSGPQWMAQLFAIDSANLQSGSTAVNNNLLALGANSQARFSTRVSTTSSLSGTWNTPSSPPAVPGITQESQRATFQVRVWDTRFASSWAELLQPGHESVFRGYSDLFEVPYPLGGTASGTPNPAPNMQGLLSFNVFVVPEPSVIALGVLGAGCLFLLRRRK